MAPDEVRCCGAAVTPATEDSCGKRAMRPAVTECMLIFSIGLTHDSDCTAMGDFFRPGHVAQCEPWCFGMRSSGGSVPLSWSQAALLVRLESLRSATADAGPRAAILFAEDG
jgi:hypothetical protein